MKLLLKLCLLLVLPMNVFGQGVEASKFRQTPFAKLGTPVNGQVRRVTDGTAGAPCTGGGTGAWAYANGTSWTCTTQGPPSASDLPSGIDAAKIADGTVSSAEFQFLNTVTSNVQTQIDSKQASLGFTPENSANKDAASGYAGLTSGSLLKTAEFPAFTGDITTTSGGVATVLATVNGNVGTFGSATTSLTVSANGKGLITAISSQTVTPAVGSITGLGANVGAWLATPSSANLAAAVSDETGTLLAVFSNSPTFTGTPLSTTAAVDTNTTQIATTAYVIGQAYAKLASPTFTGTPTLPTGTIATTQSAGNSTTAIATTAFVTTADNLKANLASPTFTGTVGGTNVIPLTTLAQIATNTIAGNSTSGTANITALSIGSCSTAGSALIWTTNTGFGCNTAINTSFTNLTGTATSAQNGFFSYNTSGTQNTNEHAVRGGATLSAGSVTVTLSGSAVFTSNTAYVCTFTDTSGILAVSYSRTSGSQFTISGTTSDTVHFLCFGN